MSEKESHTIEKVGKWVFGSSSLGEYDFFLLPKMICVTNKNSPNWTLKNLF